MWALGVCAIEMAETVPPRWAVHPVRVIFMISRDPPPRLTRQPERWSPLLHDFVSQALIKVRVLPCTAAVLGTVVDVTGTVVGATGGSTCVRQPGTHEGAELHVCSYR